MVLDKKYKILENRFISGRTWILRVKAPDLVNSPAGSFAMVKPTYDNQFDPSLRRAFAIADIQNDEILFFYDVYGRGTEQLTRRKVGEYIDILAPLGNRFFPENYDSFILVGGGIGFAGLSLFMRRLKEQGKDFIAIYGVRRLEQLSMLDWIKENGFENDVIIYTEDGSFGEKGLVTRDLREIILSKKNPMLAVCGPKAMMRAVLKEVKDLNVDTYLSLESKMACGYGICIGCVVKNLNTNKYERVCYEGPVFKGFEVEF